MKRNAKKIVWLLYIYAMLVLILDSKTAINSAEKGISLCIHSIIPSLFPFIFLSGMLTANLSDIPSRGARLFSKLLRIPLGSEMLVMLGFLGGYPVGAQNVCNAHCNGMLNSSTARRMLIFCNNAGPAFIFGIVTPQLNRPLLGWCLWGILILSSFVTALLIPGNSECSTKLDQSKQSIPQILTNTLKSMGCICGWVVIFRVFLGFAEKWLLHMLPPVANVLISGLLELTNGCTQLKNIQDEFARFSVSAILLSAGGLCVTMQTATVAAKLRMNGYLPGKVLQVCICYILSLVIRPILFPGPAQFQHYVIGIAALITAVFCTIYLKYNKEYSRFSKKSIVYCHYK